MSELKKPPERKPQIPESAWDELDAFRRLRFLDAGAFGSVYCGRHELLGNVALKFCAVRQDAAEQSAEERAKRKTLEREVRRLGLCVASGKGTSRDPWETML
eukprot:scaffold1616_cov310-Pinguiococcus_pyrenoidosus.AAC.28